MRQSDVLIKWTGSKRLQVRQIIDFFPKEIKTYFEPFLGGGSILYAVLSSDIRVERFECSDINSTLINVLEIVQKTPDELFSFYANNWPCNRDKYYKIRKEFNQDKDPNKFFFLLRTCRNGAVRFNSKGEFNIAFHEGREGISPDNLRPVISDWNKKLQNVTLCTRDYSCVSPSSGDFVYLDPPWPSSTCFYYGIVKFDLLWSWIRELKSEYVLSMQGIDVPEDLYDERYDISGGFHRLNRIDKVSMLNGLYIKRG